MLRARGSRFWASARFIDLSRNSWKLLRKHKIGYPSKVSPIGAVHWADAFHSIGKQKAHSPVDRESERDLPVVHIEVANASRDGCLVDGFIELLLEEQCGAADFQPDRRGLRANAHDTLLQLNHIVQCRSPMPSAQGSSQLKACGNQEETKGGVKLTVIIKVALGKAPGVSS
jgi:hypothetical protein